MALKRKTRLLILLIICWTVVLILSLCLGFVIFSIDWTNNKMGGGNDQCKVHNCSQVIPVICTKDGLICVNDTFQECLVLHRVTQTIETMNVSIPIIANNTWFNCKYHPYGTTDEGLAKENYQHWLGVWFIVAISSGLPIMIGLIGLSISLYIKRNNIVMLGTRELLTQSATDDYHIEYGKRIG